MRVASLIAVYWKISDFAAFLSFEIKEFHIDLYMMPRHLFLIADG